MFQIFEQLANIIVTIIDFIGTMIRNLILIVEYMVKAPVYILQAFAFIPAFITVPLMAIISFSLIVNILNKGG